MMLRSPLLALVVLAAMPIGIAQAARPIGPDAAACEGAPGSAIQANVTGLKDRTGRLKLELYPATQEDFLKDDRDLIAQGKIFRRVWAAMPASGPVELCIKVPKAGRYALFFTHDRDGKNKFDIWSDGLGLPNSTKIGRSKPKVETALVDVGEGVTVVNVKTQYLRGLSGFGVLKNKE